MMELIMILMTKPLVFAASFVSMILATYGVQVIF